MKKPLVKNWLGRLSIFTDRLCRRFFEFGWSDFFVIKHKCVDRTYSFQALAFENTCKCGAKWFNDFDELKVWRYAS